MINASTANYISELQQEFTQLKQKKLVLLRLIDETELPDAVYNSNAIENSTLTLEETEQILLEQSLQRQVSVRELFEAKNLARVTEYLGTRSGIAISVETITLLHHMLLGGIDDSIAGRLRRKNEYVRVGRHIAPAPEHLEALLQTLFVTYANASGHLLERVAYFHLEFERIHPFVDGNGRIGRVLINLQLAQAGLPPIIIRNKGKRDNYYPAFKQFEDNGTASLLERQLALALMESLHKRLAYLRSKDIITLTVYAEKQRLQVNTLLNAARRQTIPAFRVKGRWHIAADTKVDK